jgi:hypothetical protein
MRKAVSKGAADLCSSAATATGAVAAGEGGGHVYLKGEMGRNRNCCQQNWNKVGDYRIHLLVHNVQNSCLKLGEKEKE